MNVNVQINFIARYLTIFQHRIVGFIYYSARYHNIAGKFDIV